MTGLMSIIITSTNNKNSNNTNNNTNNTNNDNNDDNNTNNMLITIQGLNFRASFSISVSGLVFNQ